eukprot:GHVU01047584.1.p2 GENE.GHVU01047584.1~~GHVU01047584.1.p2  ORF type:complete len:104 (+),score=0.63 GHVU01047584.1:381-692(+)
MRERAHRASCRIDDTFIHSCSSFVGHHAIYSVRLAVLSILFSYSMSARAASSFVDKRGEWGGRKTSRRAERSVDEEDRQTKRTGALRQATASRRSRTVKTNMS